MLDDLRSLSESSETSVTGRCQVLFPGGSTSLPCSSVSQETIRRACRCHLPQASGIEISGVVHYTDTRKGTRGRRAALNGKCRNEERPVVVFLEVLLYVTQGCVFLFCMYRALSLGRAYERRLSEKYPDVAEKRRTVPLYRMTFPGLPIFGYLTGEAELEDASLHRMRRAVYCYLIGACVTVCLPSLAVLMVTGSGT